MHFFFLKLDIILLSIIIVLVLYDLFSLKFINYLTQIIIILLILILFYLVNEFILFWNYFYLIQIFIIFISILIFKYRFIFFYLSVCLFCIFLILINQNDRNIFYLIIGISFLNDTVAYIFGSKFKGPLIIPSISPKKTWSGTLVSFILSIVTLYILNFSLLFSSLVAISLFLGDIFFSYIKRSLNIKDFSKVLGNHGGILDRLDSMFLASIIFQFYLITN